MKAGLIVAVAAVAGAPCSAQEVLVANPGPANNGGSAGWGIFFDLEAMSPGLIVTHLTTASSAAAGAAFEIEVFTREGSGLGGPVGSGPGSSSSGWTSLGIASATQGPVASQVSELIDIPDINLGGGGITGVALVFSGAGPRYVTGSTLPYGTYSDANIELTTGDARSSPFTTGGSFFSPREFVGSITYIPAPAPLALLGLGGLAAVRRRR